MFIFPTRCWRPVACDRVCVCDVFVSVCVSICVLKKYARYLFTGCIFVPRTVVHAPTLLVPSPALALLVMQEICVKQM